ncbi:MAG: hypothetical protein OHK0052_20640 [Anaerolineales bacterium]
MRPPKSGTCRIYKLELRLWEGEDNDLITFFESIPERGRSRAIKFALRSGQLPISQAEADVFTEDDLDDLLSGFGLR